MTGRARVDIVEIDLSSRVPSFPGIYGAMTIATSKGDILTPRLVTSESELFRRFMSTDKILPRDPLSLFEARIFLQKSNKLWISRPDCGQTYGGATLAQDIPVHELKVSVNQGLSAVYFRQTNETEAEESQFVYSTVSDGDPIQVSGTLPEPLLPDTNYFAVKFNKDKLGIRIAQTKEAALLGEFIEFTSAGSNVSLHFTPDDINGEQEYPVRYPEGFELDTSDGKAAGFESVFTPDVDGDYLDVTKNFYKACETGDEVSLLGEIDDLPAVGSGLPFDQDESYWVIKVPQEGQDADKYHIQLARTEAQALMEEPIDLGGRGGPSFELKLETKSATANSVTLDLDTDLFLVSQKFYDAVSNNDKIKMTADAFPAIAGDAKENWNPEDINLKVGDTIEAVITKTPAINITDADSIASYATDYGTDYFGIWKDPNYDSDTHFGAFKITDGNYSPIVDLWNTSDGWKQNLFTVDREWITTNGFIESNCSLAPNSFAMDTDIIIGYKPTVNADTVFYAIKSPINRQIALAPEKNGEPLDFITAGSAISLVDNDKEDTCKPVIDLSKDSISVSETFYEMTETGYKVSVSSDGTLPTGLSAGIPYYVIKTGTNKVIKLATSEGNAELGITVDIFDEGELDTIQNQYHHIEDHHNELYTGYKRKVGYLHTSTPTDEEIYYKLYHYPYEKDDSKWSDFDQSCADMVKEPGAFLLLLYKKYGEQFLEVERFTCSRNESHVDGYGTNIYVEKVLESSNYVRWIDNKGVDANVFPVNQTTYAKLTGGSLGHAATTGEHITAVRQLANKRRYPVTLIMDAGWSIPAYQQAIIDVCESRGATLGILSTPIDVEMSSNYLEDIVAYRRKQLITSTSHAALYTPHVKIYDEYNDREIYISPTGHVGACISSTSENYEPWYAPAGNRRGVLNVLGVRREFTEGDLDYIYDAGINPIDFHETYGIRIWGQKTLLTRASALDRVNVRMLLIVIEPAIDEFLQDYVFEFNDEDTRRDIVNKITPYLASIQQRRGLYQFDVICNEENNTAEVIDANEIHVDLPLWPTKVGERILAKLSICSTGATFSLS